MIALRCQDVLIASVFADETLQVAKSESGASCDSLKIRLNGLAARYFTRRGHLYILQDLQGRVNLNIKAEDNTLAEEVLQKKSMLADVHKELVRCQAHNSSYLTSLYHVLCHQVLHALLYFRPERQQVAQVLHVQIAS